MAKDKRAKRKPPDARKPGKASADNNMEIAALRRELTEAHQREAATADVLKVISRSTFDLQAVLDTLVESAARLCEADHGWLFQRDDEVLRGVSSFGHATEVHARIRDFFRTHPTPLDRGSISGRAALEGRVVQVLDVLADPEYTWGDAQKIGGYRSALGVPLLREDNVVGVLFVTKTVPQAFTARQIDLVTTFADQAVIAIENARLFDEVQARTKELTESLEQQTATSEVLQVISSSPGELQPVFQKMLEKATRVCNAKFGTMLLSGRGRVSNVALHNIPLAYAESMRRQPLIQAPPDGPLDRAAPNEAVVHVADLQRGPDLSSRPSAVSGNGRCRRCANLSPYSDGQRGSSLSARSAYIARRYGRSPTNRSSWSRTSPSRPSSPSRTPGCLESCARNRFAATDCNLGGVASHQFVARRARAGVRGHAGEGHASLRRQVWQSHAVGGRRLP